MKATITVTLEIECESQFAARHAVNEVLDNGDFQIAVEDWADDNDVPLNITSILLTESRP